MRKFNLVTIINGIPARSNGDLWYKSSRFAYSNCFAIFVLSHSLIEDLEIFRYPIYKDLEYRLPDYFRYSRHGLIGPEALSANDKLLFRICSLIHMLQMNKLKCF